MQIKGVHKHINILRKTHTHTHTSFSGVGSFKEEHLLHVEPPKRRKMVPIHFPILLFFLQQDLSGASLGASQWYLHGMWSWEVVRATWYVWETDLVVCLTSTSQFIHRATASISDGYHIHHMLASTCWRNDLLDSPRTLKLHKILRLQSPCVVFEDHHNLRTTTTNRTPLHPRLWKTLHAFTPWTKYPRLSGAGRGAAHSSAPSGDVVRCFRGWEAPKTRTFACHRKDLQPPWTGEGKRNATC